MPPPRVNAVLPPARRRTRQLRLLTASSNALATVAAAHLWGRGHPLAAGTQLAITVCGTSMRLCGDAFWTEALRHHDALACGANLALAIQAAPRIARVRTALAMTLLLWPARYATWTLAGPQTWPDAAVQVATHVVNAWGWLGWR